MVTVADGLEDILVAVKEQSKPAQMWDISAQCVAVAREYKECVLATPKKRCCWW